MRGVAVMATADLAPRKQRFQVLHGPTAGTTRYVVWLGLSQGDDPCLAISAPRLGHELTLDCHAGDDDVHDLLHVLGLRACSFFFGLDLFCLGAVRVSLFDTVRAHAGLRERWFILLSHGRSGAVRLDDVQCSGVVLARVREIVGLRRDGRSHTSNRRGLRALRQGGLREAFQGTAFR